MKNILIHLLTGLYLLLSLGVDIRMHYCHGDLEWVKVNDVGKDSCCHEDPAEAHGCCDDEQVVFQLNIDQQPAQMLSFQDVELVPVGIGDLFGNDYTFVQSGKINPLQLDLPPPPNQSLLIMGCSLLFYG